MQQTDLRRCVFCVTSCNYTIDSAGTSRVVRAHQVQALEAGLDFIAAFPITKNMVVKGRVYSLHTGVYGIVMNGQYAGVKTRSGLLSLLAVHSPCAVLLHHLIWHKIPDVQKIICAVPGVPVLFYLHDYYTCCVQPYLFKNNASFCGGQDCDGCMYQKSRKAHLRRVNTLISRCADRITFVSPSDYAKTIWLRCNPRYAGKTMVLSHLKSAGLQPTCTVQAPLRVAFVGSQTKEKGWEIWRESAKNCKNVQLFYFGNGQKKLPNVENVLVETALQGQDAMAKALRARGIQAVALLSVVPETYSFTMYESRAAGCYVLTLPESGNIARTVETEGFGCVFENATALASAFQTPDDILARINEYNRQHPQIPASYVDNDAWLALFDHQQSAKVQTCTDSPLMMALAAIADKMYTRKRIKSACAVSEREKK